MLPVIAERLRRCWELKHGSFLGQPGRVTPDGSPQRGRIELFLSRTESIERFSACPRSSFPTAVRIVTYSPDEFAIGLPANSETSPFFGHRRHSLRQRLPRPHPRRVVAERCGRGRYRAQMVGTDQARCGQDQRRYGPGPDRGRGRAREGPPDHPHSGGQYRDAECEPVAGQHPRVSYVNAAKVDTGRDFHRDMDRVILSLTVLTARSPETTDPGTIKRLTITPVAAVRTRTRLSAVSLAGIVCLFVAAIAATAWSFRIDLLGSMERQQAAKVPGTPNDPPSATSPGPSVASITAAPTPSGPDRSMVTHAPAPAASALKSPPAQPATNAVDPAVEFALAANHSSPHAAPAFRQRGAGRNSRVGIAPPHSAKAGDMGAEITTPPDQQAASVAPSAPSVRRVPSDPPPATLLLQSLTNPRLLKNEWPSLDLQSIPFRRSILRSGGVTGRLPQP